MVATKVVGEDTEAEIDPIYSAAARTTGTRGCKILDVVEQPGL